MNWYNGYSPAERLSKLDEQHRLFGNGRLPPWSPPCQMCSDPTANVAPHDEDYSRPYRWTPPATYALCAICHRQLHLRFARPLAWAAYKAHLRRGGYGSDLPNRAVDRELTALITALRAGRPFGLEPMRKSQPAGMWWDRLTLDPASLTASWARAERKAPR